MSDHADHQARLARPDAIIERANTLPPLPEVAAWLARLTSLGAISMSCLLYAAALVR
jgi:hypothetical protein